MTNKIAYLPMIGVAAVTGMILAPQAVAIDKTATQTQLAFQAAPDKNGKPGVGVAAVVSPAPPAGERVVVRYFKRHNGQWELRGTHRPKLDDHGIAQTAFYPRAKHGTCKLTGHYRGDDTYAASRSKMVFDCATGQVKQ